MLTNHLICLLKELNLEHNNLKQVDDENINSIFSSLGHLNMSGNPWTCEGKNMFNFVRRFSEKVQLIFYNKSFIALLLVVSLNF